MPLHKVLVLILYCWKLWLWSESRLHMLFAQARSIVMSVSYTSFTSVATSQLVNSSGLGCAFLMASPRLLVGGHGLARHLARAHCSALIGRRYWGKCQDLFKVTGVLPASVPLSGLLWTGRWAAEVQLLPPGRGRWSDSVACVQPFPLTPPPSMYNLTRWYTGPLLYEVVILVVVFNVHDMHFSCWLVTFLVHWVLGGYIIQKNPHYVKQK